MIVEEAAYLEHVGVKGMRWGHRKKKDRPVSERKQAVLNKRKQSGKKYEAEAADYDKKIKAAISRPAITNRQKRAVIEEVNDLRKKKETALINAKAKNEGKRFTPAQKKIVKGAAITAGVLAAIGTYKMTQSGQTNSFVMKGKQILQNRDTPFLKKPSLSKKDVTEDFLKKEVMSPMIKNRGSFGNSMNCRRCTFAYEMRRRGFDVKPTRTTNASGQHAGGLLNATRPGERNPKSTIGLITTSARKSNPQLNELMKNPGGIGKHLVENHEGSDGLFRQIEKLPKGARGEVGMLWAGGGGR